LASATHAADFLEKEAFSETFIDLWLRGEFGSGSIRCDLLLGASDCFTLIGLADFWLAISSLATDADFLLKTSYLMLGCFDLLLAISSTSSFAIFSDFLLSISASSAILCDL
jgi:hypothetical protein